MHRLLWLRTITANLCDNIVCFGLGFTHHCELCLQVSHIPGKILGGSSCFHASQSGTHAQLRQLVITFTDTLRYFLKLQHNLQVQSSKFELLSIRGTLLIFVKRIDPTIKVVTVGLVWKWHNSWHTLESNGSVLTSILEQTASNTDIESNVFCNCSGKTPRVIIIGYYNKWRLHQGNRIQLLDNQSRSHRFHPISFFSQLNNISTVFSTQTVFTFWEFAGKLKACLRNCESSPLTVSKKACLTVQIFTCKFQVGA